MQIRGIRWDRKSHKVQSRIVDDNCSFHRFELISDTFCEIPISKEWILFVHVPFEGCEIAWPEFDQGSKLHPNHVLTYTFPLKDTFLRLTASTKLDVNIIAITLKGLHSYFDSDFGNNSDEVSAFAGSLRTKSLFSVKPVSPALTVTFHQVFANNLPGLSGNLLLKGKFLEFLSVFMNDASNNPDLENHCPFIHDQMEMDKIREAREIIIRDLSSPPSLKQLAKEVGTNEYKLKVGFKGLFGNTVYGFLTEYKMEQARLLLELRGNSIKEIAYKVGYSNPSHFISAYKKRFGITPKKYLSSR